MIPVTLQLCNFLSYGNDVPAIDFTSFNIACLSGGNGQGKSALLDALTWVIWGEGRKAQQEKKADRGLLKIGEKEMWVDLVIDLEGDRYRIIRKYSLIKNRSHSELELMVLDPRKDEFIPLSSPSIRETQKRINDILRMDYNTFVNSAFILQGRVDEFTRKSALERKQILSEVLGLSRYEQLSLLARKRIRELEKDIIAIQSRLDQIEREVSLRDKVINNIKTIELDEKRILTEIEEKKKIIQNLEQEYNRLNYDRGQLKEITKNISIQKEELHDLGKRREKIKENIKEYQLLLFKEEEILSDYVAYLDLSQQSQQMLQLMQEYRILENEKRETENQIEQNRNWLSLQLKQRKEKHNELNQKVNSLSLLREDMKKLELKIEYFQELQVKKEKIEQEGNLSKITLEGKEVQLEKLRDDVLHNQKKLVLLKKDNQQLCPLCRSPLDEQKRDEIVETMEQDINKLKEKARELNREIDNLSNKNIVLRKEWQKIQSELNKKKDIEREYNNRLLLLKEGEKAFQEIAVLVKEIEMLQIKIDGNLFSEEERKKLIEIENKIGQINYSDKKYIDINLKLDALKDTPLKREKLLEAKTLLINLRTEKEEIDRRFQNKEVNITRLKRDLNSLRERVDKISHLKDSLHNELEKFGQLEKEQQQLFLKKGASRENLSKIEQLLIEQKSVRKNREKIIYEKEIYEKLNNAFGKNGIPSMIIENAIPELEDEANAILNRLSDEHTTISLESLKELQSGELRETLNIKINDEMGIRPYELYSGGEAFRIDFALRIALSKLLTYRSGARLRTLVIDEGFGTQDEEGLHKLIHAINSIQNDFNKILVITHLSVLKDAFPVRIEVWKDPVLGSRFEIIHQ